MFRLHAMYVDIGGKIKFLLLLDLAAYLLVEETSIKFSCR